MRAGAGKYKLWPAAGKQIPEDSYFADFENSYITKSFDVVAKIQYQWPYSILFRKNICINSYHKTAVGCIMLCFSFLFVPKFCYTVLTALSVNGKYKTEGIRKLVRCLYMIGQTLFHVEAICLFNNVYTKTASVIIIASQRG